VIATFAIGRVQENFSDSIRRMDTPTFPGKPGAWSLSCQAAPTADQALKFAESLVRGEPNRGKIAHTASPIK
jgi:hypothetical protein